MRYTYKSLLFEMSLYYILLVFCLPSVYAVTYHLPFMEVYTLEWLVLSFFCYPLVLLLSAIRYGYRRMKHTDKKMI